MFKHRSATDQPSDCSDASARQDERAASRSALLEDISRLERQRGEAEERISSLETQASTLRRGMGEAEALARDAAAERDRCGGNGWLSYTVCRKMLCLK